MNEFIAIWGEKRAGEAGGGYKIMLDQWLRPRSKKV